MRRYHISIKVDGKDAEDFIGAKTVVVSTIQEYMNMLQDGKRVQITINNYDSVFRRDC